MIWSIPFLLAGEQRDFVIHDPLIGLGAVLGFLENRSGKVGQPGWQTHIRCCGVIPPEALGAPLEVQGEALGPPLEL